MQIGAVALEKLVRRERQENIEVAGRPAAQARLAFAGKPDARAVLDAGRNIHRQRALARDAAGAASKPDRDRRSPGRGPDRPDRCARA